jgi:hypothetical protein
MTRFLLAVAAAGALAAQTGGAIQYTKDGSFELPADYREWVFLSSGINMTYGPNAGNAANPRFENVFVNPPAYASFMKTGMWPDRTMLVLEIRNSDSKVSINKDGRVQTSIGAIEVHVKDTAHTNNAGNGGWSFYAFGKGAQEGKPFARTSDCFTCHEKNGSVDSTFVQFYPTLIDIAKAHGTFKPGAE